MSRKRSRPVAPIKDRKAASLFVGVITVEQQLKMRQASNRQAEIDAGFRLPRAGYHNSDVRQKTRRERKQWKQEVKSEF